MPGDRAILAGFTGLSFTTDEYLPEHDRSAAGYLPVIEFGAAAGEFFARPSGSVRGWKTAANARRRIESGHSRF